MNIKFLLIVSMYLLMVMASQALANEEYIREMTGENEFDYDDSGDVPWKEDQLGQLIPPLNENLKKLDIDHPPVGFTVYIDTTSISLSESDRVIRYWLVLKAGKSRNAMYEGIKCNSREYKTYAYENKWKKGKVNVSKVAKWLPIKSDEGHNFFRYELRKFYFCSGILPRPVEDIKDIIAGYKSTTSEYDPTYHYAQ